MGLLGVLGFALSYSALQQVALAVHVPRFLSYAYPPLVDGFIAYGVRAILVLRTAPLHARLYAWALFGVATSASIWANTLHAVDLNQPGTTQLHLGSPAVAVLAAIPPLALGGATHLHVLIARYGSSQEEAASLTPVSATPASASDSTQPLPEQPAGVPYAALAATPSQQQSAEPGAGAMATHATSVLVDGTHAGAGHTDCQDPDSSKAGSAEEHVRAGQGSHVGSGPLPAASAGGRPALASITELAEVISFAHSDGSGLTRDSARKAVTDAGLGAGTERLAEAMALVRQRAETRQHPAD